MHPLHVFRVTHMVRYPASLVKGRGRRFRRGWDAIPWPGTSNGRPDSCPLTLPCMEVTPVSRPTVRRRCLSDGRELPARCVTGRWTSAYFDRIYYQDRVSDFGACHASHCSAKPVLYRSVWLMLSFRDPCATLIQYLSHQNMNYGASHVAFLARRRSWSVGERFNLEHIFRPTLFLQRFLSSDHFSIDVLMMKRPE